MIRDTIPPGSAGELEAELVDFDLNRERLLGNFREVHYQVS
jgi:hypothetical protein